MKLGRSSAVFHWLMGYVKSTLWNSGLSGDSNKCIELIGLMWCAFILIAIVVRKLHDMWLALVYVDVYIARGAWVFVLLAILQVLVMRIMYIAGVRGIWVWLCVIVILIVGWVHMVETLATWSIWKYGNGFAP